MKSRWCINLSLRAVLVLVPLVFANSSKADFELGFSSGLANWTSSDSTLVTAQNGLATITESVLAQETNLFLDFNVPAGATSLSFILNQVNPDQDILSPPDAFGASLLDPVTGLSLVSTVDNTTDSFYVRDVVTGVTQGQAADGVTTSPAADALPLLITLDVSKLIGQDARIFFRLIAGGELSTSNVVISDVIVHTRSVPEPGTLSLVLMGSLTLICYARTRRGRIS